MPLTPKAVDRFGGLDLMNDPQEVGAASAISMLDVTLNDRGRLTVRPGRTKFNTSTPSGSYYSVIETTAGAIGSRYLVGLRTGTPRNLDRISNAGVVTAGAATFPANFIPGQTCNIGTATNTYLYICDSADAASAIQRWDGAVLANGTGRPHYVTTSPTSNRLVQGYYTAAANSPSGANGTRSTVFFSDPGLPDTYGANNWVQLDPGDGGVITAMVTWRDLLFVFKETKMYVFYGESTGADGNPIFNYRTVDLPSPMVGQSVNIGSTLERGLDWSAAAGRDGVYFVTRTGVYVTNGGPPVLISQALRGAFEKTAGSSDLQIKRFTFVRWAQNLLYVGYASQVPTKRCFVWDPLTNQWSVQSLATVDAPIFESRLRGSSFGSTDATDTMFPSNADVLYADSTSSTDDGVAIASNYQSGFYEMGPAGAEVFTRWSRLWGYGTPTFSIFTDMGTTDANAASVTLGINPTVAEGYHLKSYKGILFSHKINSASGTWSVSKLQHDIRNVRP